MIEEGVVEMSQDHTTLCKAMGAWGVIYSATGAPIVSPFGILFILKLFIVTENVGTEAKFSKSGDVDYRIRFRKSDLMC